MEDVEYILHEYDSQTQLSCVISPIMIGEQPNGIRLTEIRMCIEENDLLDFSFDFWNSKANCRFDRRFEKVNKVRGLDVFVVRALSSLSFPKRARIQILEEPVEGESLAPSSEAALGSRVSVNNCPAFEPTENMENEPYSGPSENVIASVAELEGHSLHAQQPQADPRPKLRSVIMVEQVREYWLRCVRNTVKKMERAGLSDHVWWLETWDEGSQAIAKIWCNECKKWQGNGKADQQSNTVSNFFRQHVSTVLHQKEYSRRVGVETAVAKAAAEKEAEDAIEHKKLIEESVELVKIANSKNGFNCFLVEGDLTNENLPSSYFKWKCIYCRVLHSLCPRTRNLAWNLDQHLNGERHRQRKAEFELLASAPQAILSGRVGRPTWKVSNDASQRVLTFFFPSSSSSGSNVRDPDGEHTLRADIGTYDSSFLCWGFWQRFISVNGRKVGIKALLLDQHRGTVWFAEPYTFAEIHEGNCVRLIEGCFRHQDCMRVSATSRGFKGFSCDMCRSITQEGDFRKRVWREEKAREKRGLRDTGQGRRIDFLRTDEAKTSHRKTSQKCRRLDRSIWLLRARLLRHRAKRQSFVGIQTELANRKDVTTFCQRICSSWREGMWGGKEALWDFMMDVAKNISKQRQGHRFSKNTKVMWEVVKMRAGPQVSNFLTANLHGPSLSTTRRDQKKEPYVVAGENEEHFIQVGRTYSRLKAKLGISGPIPFIFAEDETSVRKMVRWVASTDKLLGFCGFKMNHKCIHDFSVSVGEGDAGYNNIADAFADNVKSGYARIIMANPLHDSLPPLLVVAMCSCNTFTAIDIKCQWTRVERMWKKNCFDVGPVVGHASDGDSQRRCVQLHDFCQRANIPSQEFRVDWKGFPLGALVDEFGDVKGMHDQDWIHNLKKLVSPLDSSCRTLWLGPYLVRIEHLQKLFNTLAFDEHGLSSYDIDRQDRQNFKSAQTLCSRKVIAGLSKLRFCPELTNPERTEGTEIYLSICADYVDIWASPVHTIRDRVVLASKVMWFLKLWKLFIVHGEHGVGLPKAAENFISNQCFLDVVMSCHFAVLLVKLFRDKYPSLPVPFSRTGSDCCEVFFSKVGGMAGVERAYDFGDLLRSASSLNRLAEIESLDGGVQFPRAHGKMKNVWEDLHPVPLDEFGMRLTPVPDLSDFSDVASDILLVEALVEGFEEAKKLLRVLEMAPSNHCAADKSRWFRVPWEYEGPLQAKLTELQLSEAEQGDDGNEIITEQSGALELPLPLEVEINLDEPDQDSLVAALGQNARIEEMEAVAEVQHILHEMQEELEDGAVVSGQAIHPQVPLPGNDGELIWKARLVSQLNGNPFLSKDRLQRVKGGGNQYYNRDELQRLMLDPSVISLSVGHDVAVLFEGEAAQASQVADSVRGRFSNKAADISKRAPHAFVEIGRVQIIKKKVGAKWVRQKDIIDMETVRSENIWLYMYWYTFVDGRRKEKLKYDGVDKCWVLLSTVIQLVSLTYKPMTKLYVLDKHEHKHLQDYLQQHLRDEL